MMTEKSVDRWGWFVRTLVPSKLCYFCAVEVVISAVESEHNGTAYPGQPKKTPYDIGAMEAIERYSNDNEILMR